MEDEEAQVLMSFGREFRVLKQVQRNKSGNLENMFDILASQSLYAIAYKLCNCKEGDY